jgi:hypothetical protein
MVVLADRRRSTKEDPSAEANAASRCRAVQHGESRGQERPSVVVQQQAFPDTVEQPRSQLALQFEEGGAGRGLRQRHALRRRGRAAGVGDGAKNLELP